MTVYKTLLMISLLRLQEIDGDELDLNADLFELGLDSLQVTLITRKISETL